MSRQIQHAKWTASQEQQRQVLGSVGGKRKSTSPSSFFEIGVGYYYSSRLELYLFKPCRFCKHSQSS